MKKTFAAVLFLVLGAGLAVAGPAEFSKGHFFLTPQFGFASWGTSIPFGLGAEFAVTENIGLGGSAMGQFWSDEGVSVSWVTLAAEANYHFTRLNAAKFDLYVGAGLGYGIYNVGAGGVLIDSGASGFVLQPILGGRFFVSSKIALSLKLVGSVVGRYSGFGAVGGVTFKLN